MAVLLAYGVFFIDLGDKSLGGHFGDIWRSPAVQQKVGMATDGIRQNIEDRLAAAAERATRDVVREKLDPNTKSPRGEIAEVDRKALADLLERQ